VNRPEPTTPTIRPRKRACALTSTRQHGHGRWLPIAVAACGFALALAACGGSSNPSARTSPSSTSKGSPPSYAKSQLAAAACMRKHGVPDFPDPTFGAGGAQVNLHLPAAMGSSPAFALAQKDCAKLGLELAGYAGQSVTPTGGEMAQWVAVARCMRAHGVPNFPDPTTSLPPNRATYPARYSAAFDMNGIDWAIPKSIDLQAPAVKHAATACGPNAASLLAP
jgi:hypothetical protein